MRPCILLQSIRERGDKRPQVKRSFFTSRSACPYLRRLQYWRKLWATGKKGPKRDPELSSAERKLCQALWSLVPIAG